MNRILEEELLSAWMKMALNIRGNRIVDGLSFNEIVICSILYRSKENGVEMLTATDLTVHTRFLKSQLNKVLNLMEEKELIERIRSEKDKRKVYIRLREDRLSVYLDEHEKVMTIVRAVCEALGEEKAKILTELLEETVEAVELVCRQKKK